MIITRIELTEGFETSIDIMKKGFNLFTSENQNSIGKSTYCRLIFHSLGFSVPSTEGINFNKICSKIFLKERNKSFIITRENKLLSVEIKEENFKNNFKLPEEHFSFLSFLFECKNIRIIKNLLGLMYIDQEKGWTLLNRGKVIGNNRFSIDELVAGLKNIDCEELFNKRELLESQIERYQSLLNINIIKEQYYKDNNNLEIMNVGQEMKKDIASKQLEIDDIVRKIKQIDAVIRQDKTFFEYIESMNLYFKTKEGSIKITRDRIENSNNIEYLKAYKSILNNRIYELEKEKLKLVSNYEKVTYGQQNIFNENIHINVEQGINSQLSSLNLDVSSIKKLIEENKQELQQINSSIRNKIRQGNEYIKLIYDKFHENAVLLGVEKSISDKSDYIFTDDLKCRTGAIFQKLIIAYKVAVMQVVETVLNTKLLFVIDSPKSKELDDKNTELIMNFLKLKLNENQVIIFSIFDEKDLFIIFDNKIVFKNRAIENRKEDFN